MKNRTNYAIQTRLPRVPRWTAALRYQQPRRTGGDCREFRDCLLLYCDGRLRFQRYCYGEAAGPVFGVWVERITLEGELFYQKPFDIAVREDALPKKLEPLPDGTLRVDGRDAPWTAVGTLRRDRENGYGWWRVLQRSILNLLLSAFLK